MTMRTDITWTDGAWEHWGAVRDRARMIGFNFGPALGHEHMAELLESFARVTFAAGPVNVQKDGDGFYITTPRMVIGLVWTPDSDATMRKRIGQAPDETIQPDWPRTGRWSAHS